MKRLYDTIIAHHIAHREQMIFLSGPRQVGKTTIAKNSHTLTEHFKYLNWDKSEDREQLLVGADAALKGLPLHALLSQKPIIAFDEIHKYRHWRSFLKEIIDEYKGEINVVVTGSAKLNVFRRGGDSLMGRYFHYRVHPFSIAEMLRPNLTKEIFSSPKKMDQEQFHALFEFGGFPEPLIKQEKTFYYQWQNLRQEQMLREDIRDLAHIQELAQLEIFAITLQQQVGQLIDYTSLAKKIRVTDQTIRRWLEVLETFFYCFIIKPWSNNVARSLLKQPKIYLWDWSVLTDKGAKVENFVASHLLKAVHFWTDMGFGKFELYYIRDKDKREVDFLVTQNEKPWIMIEVKSSGKEPINPNLNYFQAQIRTPYAFQLAFDLPFIDRDCFDYKKPIIVPITTFLSQLI